MKHISTKPLKKVLTIAGSDSGGGAGIQADLKTFTALGVFGTSAITALTAQNTVGVQGIQEIPAAFVGRQIDSIMTDIGTDAVKIGMLSSADIIAVVANRIKKYTIKLVVLDPVMVAKGGDELLQRDAQQALAEKLFPLAYLITPNLYEAEKILNRKINSISEMKEAAQDLHKLGSHAVLIKGGHLSENQKAVDILFDGNELREFSSPRIKTKNTHGTGCTYSSAIAAELAKGHDLKKAVTNAKKYVTTAIRAGKDQNIGHGHGPLNHMVKI